MTQKRILGWRNHKLDPTVHPTVGDLRQAVGLYEGEGTAQSVKGCTQVQIQQKHRFVLDWMKARFGGSIGYVKRKRNNRSPVYNWQIAGVRARGFLMTVYPFLSPHRQRQAQKALR